MNRNRPPIRRPSPLAVLILVVGLGASAPALAAQLLKVRTGAHPEYTRVVFELDQATGYRVERVGGAVRVSLDASSRGYELGSKGDLEGLKIQGGSSSVAHLELSEPGLRIQEMILSSPPRIVLDIMRSETSQASAAPSAAPTAPRPSTVAKPTPVPAPKPTAVAKTPTPTPVAKAPAPKPTPVAKAPAPAPIPVAKAPAPKPTPVAKSPAPAPIPVAKSPAPAPIPVAKSPAPKPTTVARATTPTPAKPATPGSAEPLPEWSSVPKPKPAPAITPTPRTAPSTPAGSQETAQAYAEPTTFLDRLAGGAWKVALAAGALAFGGIAVLIRRRHRPLPNDLDVTAISEEIEESDRGAATGLVLQETEAPATPEPIAAQPIPEPEIPASASSDDSSLDGLFDGVVVPDETVSPDDETEAATASSESPRPAPGEALSLFEDTGGIVGEESTEGDAAMDREMDLPADRTMSPAPPPPPARSSAPAPSSDMSRLLQELERRMQSLESKLEESNEAREKLERQVAAQSEELRVQRAAIARTQRALRTMSRGEEEKATEPALRDGDTQAKTRVSG